MQTVGDIHNRCRVFEHDEFRITVCSYREAEGMPWFNEVVVHCDGERMSPTWRNSQHSYTSIDQAEESGRLRGISLIAELDRLT